MSPPPTPESTFYENAEKVINDALIAQLGYHSSLRLGFLNFRTMTKEEFRKEFHTTAPPPSIAFFMLETMTLYVITEKDAAGNYSMPLPELWHSILHEKGHGFYYPKSSNHMLWENATVQTVLSEARGMSASFNVGEESQAANVVHSFTNLIEDALINYIVTFKDTIEQDPMYFGWFANQSRIDYELPLMTMYDVSRTTPILTMMELHDRFMTALCWFYFGVDSYAPKKFGGVKKGIEPYREFFEITCYNCGKRFATWDWACPYCRVKDRPCYNNTLEYSPNVNEMGIFKDPRSPLVTTSSDKHVQKQYKLLQEYFLWILKLEACRYLPMKKREEGGYLFINKYYYKIVQILAELVQSGCIYLLMRDTDVPRFIQNRFRLVLTVGGKKIDYFNECLLSLPTRATLDIKKIKTMEEFEAFMRGRGDRGIVTFVQNYSTTLSKKYRTFVESLEGLSVDEVLPESEKGIMGVYDPTQYKTLDGWEEKNPVAIAKRNVVVFMNRMKSEKWTQDKFYVELKAFFDAVPEKSKKTVFYLIQSDDFVGLLQVFGWNLVRYISFLPTLIGAVLVPKPKPAPGPAKPVGGR